MIGPEYTVATHISKGKRSTSGTAKRRPLNRRCVKPGEKNGKNTGDNKLIILKNTAESWILSLPKLVSKTSPNP